MNQIAMIEALDHDELDALLEAQALQPRIPAACGGIDFDGRFNMPELAVAVSFDWMSDRAAMAYRTDMIPETELINYAITDEQIEGLWIQAGCEWHHVKRHGRLIRERFFRRTQVERFGRIIVM